MVNCSASWPWGMEMYGLGIIGDLYAGTMDEPTWDRALLAIADIAVVNEECRGERFQYQ